MDWWLNAIRASQRSQITQMRREVISNSLVVVVTALIDGKEVENSVVMSVASAVRGDAEDTEKRLHD